jgi:hypothetical protein
MLEEGEGQGEAQACWRGHKYRAVVAGEPPRCAELVLVLLWWYRSVLVAAGPDAPLHSLECSWLLQHCGTAVLLPLRNGTAALLRCNGAARRHCGTAAVQCDGAALLGCLAAARHCLTRASSPCRTR